MSPKRILPLSSTLLLVWIALSCNSFFPDETKPTVPPDHDINLDGALHKRGYERPFHRDSSCFAYHCHHASLRGGWALAKENQGSDLLVESYGPSCYQCHGVEWHEENFTSIRFTYPAATSIWRHGRFVFAEWLGPKSDSVTVYLYKGDEQIDIFHPQTINEHFVDRDQVPESWGRGFDFRLKAVQSNDVSGHSEPFSILGPDEDIVVNAPNPSTTWRHGGEAIVEWSRAEGSWVRIDLYKEGVYAATFLPETQNDGLAGVDIVPQSWGVGDNYQVKVTDSADQYGFSLEFSIAEAQ